MLLSTDNFSQINKVLIAKSRLEDADSNVERPETASDVISSMDDARAQGRDVTKFGDCSPTIFAVGPKNFKQQIVETLHNISTNDSGDRTERRGDFDLQ